METITKTHLENRKRIAIENKNYMELTIIEKIARFNNIKLD